MPPLGAVLLSGPSDRKSWTGGTIGSEEGVVRWDRRRHSRERAVRIVWPSTCFQKPREALEGSFACKVANEKNELKVSKINHLQTLRGSFSAVSTPIFASKYNVLV